MPTLLLFLCGLAGFGLLISFVTHVAALFGARILSDELFMVLVIGVFVLGLPTVLASNRLVRDVPQRDYWQATFRGCSPWMRSASLGIFLYAIVNFILLALAGSSEGEPSHGLSSAALAVTGLLMLFYAMHGATLYSAARVWHESGDIECPNGHKVNPLSKFCNQCGQPVSRQGGR